MADPRPHHYCFAHQVLRDRFFEEPGRLLTLLRSDRGTRAVHDLWERCGELIASLDRRRLPPDGLGVHPMVQDARPAVVVTLPAPVASLEAGFVALLGASSARDPEYFTLEKAAPIDPSRAAGSGPGRGVLCGWTGDGKHLNLGDTMEMSLAAFAGRLKLTPA